MSHCERTNDKLKGIIPSLHRKKKLLENSTGKADGGGSPTYVVGGWWRPALAVLE